MSKLSDKKREDIKKAFNDGIASIMEWYTGPNSEAVDCPETRSNINKDLDWLVGKVENQFNLRKIPLKLRCRTDGTGMLTVRFEIPNLA